MIAEQDLVYMQAALKMAQQGTQQDEVPVGAVVVCQGKIIAQAYNAPISTHDPSAHAEIRALRLAAQALKNYRLIDCTLYVTLEPCVMCAGAIMHARIKRLIYAASDYKTGACGSVVNLFAESALNHHTTVTGGVMAQEAIILLKDFFTDKRLRAKQQKDRLLMQAHPQ
jgi:tRNA(adenine34) deaminase